MIKGNKRSSEIIDKIRERRNPVEFKKTRNKMLIAAKIQDAIEQRGWTKSQFAKEINQTPSTVSRWLSGYHNSTQETLVEIGHVLGIDLFNLGNEIKGNASIKGKTVHGAVINVFVTNRTQYVGSPEAYLHGALSAGNVQTIPWCEPIEN